MKKTNSTSTTPKATLGDIMFNLIFTIIFIIGTMVIMFLGIRADMMEHPALTTPEERAIMHIEEEPEEDVLSAYITNEVR